VTGGRAPSFPDLSVGEAPAPSRGEENGGGGKFPSQISRRKDQPGRLGTQEKVPALSRCDGPMQTLLNVTKGSHRTSLTSDRVGTFSEVTGGRAPSFHDLSVGETPGPERMRGDQREGAKLPRR
jgi:hypothetical protein